MMDLVFRKCELSDLDELQDISKSTFVTAFSHQNNPSDFHAYITSAFSKEKLSAEIKNPNTSFYFVEDSAVVIAYFKLNVDNAQSELKEQEGLELERIYVKPSHQGKGIGSKILNRVEVIAKAFQKNYVWLGVWEHNPKAIKFYQDNNYIKFGTHPYYIGQDKQTDWLLKKKLK